MAHVNMHIDNVFEDVGSDSYIAWRINKAADIKLPFRSVLPAKLYEFAIKFSVKTPNLDGGYLFSVVNPFDTVVQLGVEMSPVVNGRWNVSLKYTDSNQLQATAELVWFETDYNPDWTQMGLGVYKNHVNFYIDCEQVQQKNVHRVPVEFQFDSASTLYVGQAGPIIGHHFEVSTCFWFQK